MQVPACYRSFGLNRISMENTFLTDETSADGKRVDKNAISFKKSIECSPNQKKHRKYKAPFLGTRG